MLQSLAKVILNGVNGFEMLPPPQWCVPWLLWPRVPCRKYELNLTMGMGCVGTKALHLHTRTGVAPLDCNSTLLLTMFL